MNRRNKKKWQKPMLLILDVKSQTHAGGDGLDDGDFGLS